MVQHVMSLLKSGVTPVFTLRVRKGRDFRVIKVMGSGPKQFHCVFVDSLHEEAFTLSHDSINHGTFILEEAEIATP